MGIIFASGLEQITKNVVIWFIIIDLVIPQLYTCTYRHSTAVIGGVGANDIILWN